nr:MAG TPA: hypothetical protein [Caudoviricetes sp.]
MREETAAKDRRREQGRQKVRMLHAHRWIRNQIYLWALFF